MTLSYAVCQIMLALFGATWNVDFQGDTDHAGLYGQTDPIAHTEPGVTWNTLQVQAFNSKTKSQFQSNASLDLRDSEGNDSGVVLQLTGDLVGWAGGAGAESLVGDYLILASFAGIDTSTLTWKISGLEANRVYNLTFYAHNDQRAGRGIRFSMNRGVELQQTNKSPPKSVKVVADGRGAITGTARSLRDAGSEGNWAGLRIERVINARRWTDNTGKFSVEADLIEIINGSAVLQRSDGKTATVPLGRLSDSDWSYLSRLERMPLRPISADTPEKEPAFPDPLTEPPIWNDLGTPFDIAEFLKAPLPAQNAAPLYLDALFEFDNNVSGCFATGQVKEYPPDVLQRYLIAGQRSRQAYQFYKAWEADPESVDVEAVDDWLTEYDLGFQKLAAAQKRPKCRFQTGYSFHTLVTHIHTARSVSSLISWRIRRDLSRGDFQRPLDDLQLMLRLNRDLRPGGFAVSQLVSIALDGQCCERVREILNAPGVDVATCDTLLSLLTEHESQSIDMVAEFQRADYITARQALYDLQHRTGTFDPQFMREELSIEGDTKSPLTCISFIVDLGMISPLKKLVVAARLLGTLTPDAWTGGKMLSDRNYTKEVDILNRYYSRTLSLPLESNFQRLEAEYKSAYAPVIGSALVTYVMSADITVLESIQRGKAQIRGTQCLAALRRWLLEHAEAPPDLETLFKNAGLANVPIDPFSGKPFRVATFDGETVFYSIGPDGKDDLGQVESKYGPRTPGDLVFRLKDLSAD